MVCFVNTDTMYRPDLQLAISICQQSILCVICGGHWQEKSTKDYKKFVTSKIYGPI